MHHERFARAFLDTMRNEYTGLLKKVSEIDVERWIKLVEEQREHVCLLIARASTYGTKGRERAREDITEHDQRLEETLAEFKTPIMQMSDQVSIIHDTFDSKIYSIYVPYSLISSLVRRRAEKGVPLDVGDRVQKPP